MRVDVIQVPYHHGRERSGIGNGPDRFVEAGIVTRLTDCGHDVDVKRVDRDGPFVHEIGASMDLNVALAEDVRTAVTGGRFPLVFAGDCNCCLGALAGLSSTMDDSERPPGIIWFDAHGDSNTPETSASGFFDGMSLATATGQCWTPLGEQLPGFTPVPETNVCLVGVRDLDPMEADRLDRSAITRIDASDLTGSDHRDVLASALSDLRTRTRDVYLHIDLDVLNATEIAPANGFAPPGGLGLELVEDALRTISHHFNIWAAALTAYDPSCDPEDRILDAGLDLTTTIGEQLYGE